MLYVEQPAGTGFTSGPEAMNEDDVSGDMYAFLQNFLDIFDDFRPKPFFIFGESYAGMYVPSIAHWIHQQNKKVDSSDRLIDLEGIALGNGWMDANTQGPAVIDYAWWHGMIDSHTRALLHEEWKYCASGSNELANPPLHPFTIPDECGIMEAVLTAAGKGLLTDRAPNTYDVTTFDTYPVLNSNNPDGAFMRFYNSPAVQKALNAPPTDWRGCIPGSGRRLSSRRLFLLDEDRPTSTAPYLATLMDEGSIRVLVYNGDRDLSTNSAGTEVILDQMSEWSGHKAWKTATRGLWLFHHTEMAGWARQHQHLTFLVVYNSGHLVPYNLPAQGLELVQRFVHNTSFVDKVIPPFVPTRSSRQQDGGTAAEMFKGMTFWFLVVGLVVACSVYWVVSQNPQRNQYQSVNGDEMS
jgi:carboxypeptidase C (cathepsin A)